jgi:hypothetical protein
MKLIDQKDVSYDTKWMHDEATIHDSTVHGIEFQCEFEALEKALLPGESLLEALNDLKLLLNDHGKYQIVFLLEKLPKSVAGKFKSCFQSRIYRSKSCCLRSRPHFPKIGWLVNTWAFLVVPT